MKNHANLVDSVYEVLNHNEWKKLDKLTDELEAKLKHLPSGAEMYAALLDLFEEGCIDKQRVRVGPNYYVNQYRRNQKGRRVKVEGSYQGDYLPGMLPA